MLQSILVSGCAAAILTFVSAYLLLPVARRRGLVDVPRDRHDHSRPTPVIGGVAIFIGILVVGAATNAPSAAVLAFLLAAALIVTVGVIDDLHDLSWWVRGLAQALAAVIIAFGGARAERVGGLLDLGVWSIPFTIFATIGVINAINMIDGTDGLAGSQVAIALAFFTVVALQAGNTALAGQVVVMLGAVCGFLALNLRYPGQAQARIFLGNSGSALLGLLVAWCAYRLARSPEHPVSGIVAPWMIAIPLIDCVVVSTRRMLAGRSPFSADRKHAHHLLLDAGYSPQRVVAIMAGLSLLAGCGALAWYRIVVGEGVLIGVFLAVIALHFVLISRRDRASAGSPGLAPAGARPGIAARAVDAGRGLESR